MDDMDFPFFEDHFNSFHPFMGVDIPDFKNNILEEREYSTKELINLIIENIRQIYDPEISVNIYDLGLIYEIKINENKEVLINMTLTSPNCPSAQEIPMAVHMAASVINKITDVSVVIVWEPAWGPDKMTDEAKLELGIF